MAIKYSIPNATLHNLLYFDKLENYLLNFNFNIHFIMTLKKFDLLK